MKTLKIATALLIALCSMSCLEHGLEDIETYTGNDILSVAGVYYRYYSDDVNPGSGENKINQLTMSYDATVDEETATVVCSVKIPSGFPSQQRDNVSLSYEEGSRNGILVAVNLSSAATIKPLDGAPKLGVPGDWSKPNKYRVTAADGKTKDWTITLDIPRNDATYEINDQVADWYYGWAIYSKSAGTWRFGYTPNYEAMLYLTFKSTTGDENTPPSGTLTLDNVTAATWGGSPVNLTECNLTITPEDGGWWEDSGYQICNYKLEGKVAGTLDRYTSVTFNFTATTGYPAWEYLDVAE